MSARIVHGDCLEVLPTLGTHSAHLVITSPPYWSIKDYGGDGQVGTGQSYEEYVESLTRVWRECYRVLHPGCRMAVNVGDQYLRASEHGRYRVLPIGADVTLGAVAVFFDFMGSIIWRKVTNTKTSGGGAFMGSVYFPRDGHVTYEHEYVLLFKKPGKAPRPRADELEASRIAKADRSLWFRGVWDVPPARQKDHPAAFPIEIPRRIIRMYSFAGEVVLDPFIGSGTTARAAEECGRDCVGIELNPEYVTGDGG